MNIKAEEISKIIRDHIGSAAVDVDVFRQHLRQPIVVDCVGVLLPRAEELEGAGIRYVCLGR